MRILLILMTYICLTPLFASTDYTCQFQHYKIELHLTNDRSTSIVIKDFWRYETLYTGHASSISRDNHTTDFIFSSNFGEIILNFQNDELENQPSQLHIKFEAELQGIYRVRNIKCLVD